MHVGRGKSLQNRDNPLSVLRSAVPALPLAFLEGTGTVLPDKREMAAIAQYETEEQTFAPAGLPIVVRFI